MRRAPYKKVASAIRKGMKNASKVRRMGQYTTVYYADTFKAIVTRDGRKRVVKTVLAPEEIEYAESNQLRDVYAQIDDEM